MLTAMQSARIKVTNNLVEARQKIIECRSSIIFQDGRHSSTDGLVKQIDDLLKDLVPNEPI